MKRMHRIAAARGAGGFEVTQFVKDSETISDDGQYRVVVVLFAGGSGGIMTPERSLDMLSFCALQGWRLCGVNRVPPDSVWIYYEWDGDSQ